MLNKYLLKELYFFLICRPEAAVWELEPTSVAVCLGACRQCLVSVALVHMMVWSPQSTSHEEARTQEDVNLHRRRECEKTSLEFRGGNLSRCLRPLFLLCGCGVGGELA